MFSKPRHYISSLIVRPVYIHGKCESLINKDQVFQMLLRDGLVTRRCLCNEYPVIRAAWPREEIWNNRQYTRNVLINNDMHAHKNVDKDTLKVYYMLRLKA